MALGSQSTFFSETRSIVSKPSAFRPYLKSLARTCLIFIAIVSCSFSSFAAAPVYVTVSQDGNEFISKKDNAGEILFKDSDLLKVLAWSMNNHRITVIGKGRYTIPKPISIPRSDISLIIDKGANITLNVKSVPGKRPSYPKMPVIYNQGHNNVNVISFGDLSGQAKKRGAAFFYDGRSKGKLGLNGGKIVHAGMLGWARVPGANKRPQINKIAIVADCQNVEIPLLFGDGYRIAPLEAEGCKNLNIGLVVAAPRASQEPILLQGLNEGTKIKKVIATQPLKSGVMVRNSPNTIIEESFVYGNPMKYVKIFNPHLYTNTSARFTQLPFLPDSKGSLAKKETTVPHQVKTWKKTVTLVDFPKSLPVFKVKVKLEAIYKDGKSDLVIDKKYKLTLPGSKDSSNAAFLRITTDGKVVKALDGKTGKVKFEDPDARKVIEWSLSNTPITILEKGVFTVPDLVTIPRDNVALIITQNAELRQDPKIKPPTMDGGRGGYRPLIYNPAHSNVSVINLGTLRPYAGHRSVAIHFDGRSFRGKSRKQCIAEKITGKINIDGGLIFATGPMSADDVVWVVDAKHVSVPLLLAKGYTNAPMAIEGCEDMKIGILAALMGPEAFENEAIDFNSFCQRVHIDLVIGTMPAEEIVDVNNSRDCIVDEIRVYRMVGDIMPLRINNWPDKQKRSPKIITKRPKVLHSKGSKCINGKAIEKTIAKWQKTVKLTPLKDTLPMVKVHVNLTAMFEDGSKEEVINKDFEWKL